MKTFIEKIFKKMYSKELWKAFVVKQFKKLHDEELQKLHEHIGILAMDTRMNLCNEVTITLKKLGLYGRPSQCS